MVTRKTVHKSVTRGSSNVEIVWDLSDVSEDFATKPDGSLAIYGCGCTGFTNEGKVVKGVYTHTVTGKVNKSFVVYLDDGQPLTVENSKGVKVPNRAAKRHVVLDFEITIED